MIFEVTFWIAFIFASQVIAKIYYRRRDLLHGPYRATRRGRGSKPDEWTRQKFNQWDCARGWRLGHLRAPIRPDITPVETIFLQKRSGELYRLTRQEKRL
jgi:hypothetical protein